jgi:hypothetical protein
MLSMATRDHRLQTLTAYHNHRLKIDRSNQKRVFMTPSFLPFMRVINQTVIRCMYTWQLAAEQFCKHYYIDKINQTET